MDTSDSLTSYRTVDYHDIITIEPGKRSGKPCIRGMRITVYDILEYLAGGMTEVEILEDFSELTGTIPQAIGGPSVCHSSARR
jgi:uncharacterized protein (DUF433 family)